MNVFNLNHRFLERLLETNETRLHHSSNWIHTMMPIILSTLAGLSTCLGAAIVFFVDRPVKGEKYQPARRLGDKEMCFSLSLAASVMITVSTASILPESLTDDNDETKWIEFGSDLFLSRSISFLCGCVLFFILSKCVFPEPNEILDFQVPHEDNGYDGASEVNPDSNETYLLIEKKDSASDSDSVNQKSRKRTKSSQRCETDNQIEKDIEYAIVDISATDKSKILQSLVCRNCVWRHYTFSGSELVAPEAKRAWRVTMLLFVSLAVHNFPEGLAVAASTIYNVNLGWTTTVAIALHNIPEGIAIAVPCLAARPESPWLAFGLASISGLAEPLGAAVAMLMLNGSSDENSDSHKPSFNMKNVLSFVSGIMIMVAVLDLYPEAIRHSKPGQRIPLIVGTLAGMIVMLGSEAYLNRQN